MDPNHHADIEQQRSQHGSDNDVDIGNARDFRHNEGTGPHHRRHKHAPGGGSGLHRPGKSTLVSKLFHERNGEYPGGIDVGSSYTGDRSEKP